MTNEPILNQRTTETAEVQDTLKLPFEARQKARARVCTESGRFVGIKLARGSVLRGGDILQSEDGFTVAIEAADETVSCISTADPQLLARAAYHLGNRHVWVQIGDGYVRYLHDHVLDNMLQNMGIAVIVMEAPFEPEGGAYSTAHSHSHDHTSTAGHTHGENNGAVHG